MSVSEPIQKFINWIQGFDYQILQNIDNVETNFILPMFQYLGYPERCRQSKFILHGYQSAKAIIKLEIDQVYFSTDNFTQQNPDTSLVMVVVQKQHHANLSPIVAQLRLYTFHLKPVFFIVTNGYNIHVFQCCHYSQEYALFDININALKNQEIATKFYQYINFNYVSSINKNRNNLLALKHHLCLGKALIHDPKSQDILTEFDYQPGITRDGNRLIVVKPKVAIKCNLPKAFGQGNCEIEFSNIVFRGIKIRINHQNILGSLPIGLKTQPDWRCRPFLRQVDHNAFEATLGQTTLILSEVETIDLCLCIDEICQQYKNSIIDFENNLQTWEFAFVEFAGIRGFRLFDVDSRLWELMYKFANEFDYAQGKSEWHLFHQENFSIRISRGIRDRAFIVPIISSHCSLFAERQLSIIYEINELHLKSLEKNSLTSWQQDIGPRGTWTARYTKQWLLEKYIPKVIDYYSQQTQLSVDELLSGIKANRYERPSLLEIDDIKDLLPYLRDLQSWLNLYIENIAAVHLRSYYQAFTDLVRNTDSAIDGMDYIMVNLDKIDWQKAEEKTDNSNSIYRQPVSFKKAVTCLDAQVQRINNNEYEKSFNADLLTRIFIWIIEKGKINCSQSQMNAAKQALLPLWEQSRFEMRHVYPNR